MKVALDYGGCGSAAVAVKNLGLDIDFIYEPRGEHFLNTFQKNFGGYKNKMGDIVSVIEYEEGIKPDPDIIIGQPDCKIYSNLRTRKREDVTITNTQLYYFLRDILFYEPYAFIVENLPKGIDTILNYIKLQSRFDMDLEGGTRFDGGSQKKLSEYSLIRVDINAKDYLPQSRKRSFLVGTPKFSTTNFEFLPASPDFSLKSCRKLIQDLEDEESHEIFKNHKVPNHSEERIKGFSKLGPGVSYYGTQNNRRLDPDKPAYTITSHCTQHVHYKLNRTLTVRECARFMGFPDSFVFIGPTTKQLDQVGKAIVVPVVQDLLSQVVEYLKSNLKIDK